MEGHFGATLVRSEKDEDDEAWKGSEWWVGCGSWAEVRKRMVEVWTRRWVGRRVRENELRDEIEEEYGRVAVLVRGKADPHGKAAREKVADQVVEVLGEGVVPEERVTWRGKGKGKEAVREEVEGGGGGKGKEEEVGEEEEEEAKEVEQEWVKVRSRKRGGEECKIVVWGVGDDVDMFVLRRMWGEKGVEGLEKCEVVRVGKGRGERVEVRCESEEVRCKMLAQMRMARLPGVNAVAGWGYEDRVRRREELRVGKAGVERGGVWGKGQWFWGVLEVEEGCEEVDAKVEREREIKRAMERATEKLDEEMMDFARKHGGEDWRDAWMLEQDELRRAKLREEVEKKKKRGKGRWKAGRKSGMGEGKGGGRRGGRERRGRRRGRGVERGRRR